MNETGQEIAQRTPQEILATGIRSEQFRSQIEMALPPNVTVDRFTRALLTAVMASPDIANADHQSVILAAIRCAQDGLLPDGREAAIVVFNTKVKVDGKDTWVSKAQYLPMIGGLRKALADHGWTLRTRVVYQGDEFDFTEEPPSIMHKPAPFTEGRGELIYVYAIATHKDGRRIQRVVFPDEIAKRKAVAKSKNVWESWPAEMWQKTAGHMIFDEIPLGLPDEERARIARIVAGWEDNPQQAVDAIYGPAAPALEHQAARELSQGSPVLEPPADGPPCGADGGGQAGGGDQGSSLVETAAAGSSPDPEGEQIQFGEPPLTEEPPLRVPDTVVQTAAGTVIPSQGKTIDEILAMNGSDDWVIYMLGGNMELGPERSALELVVQARRPDLWAAINQEAAA